jgi:hypothetical protein
MVTSRIYGFFLLSVRLSLGNDKISGIASSLSLFTALETDLIFWSSKSSVFLLGAEIVGHICSLAPSPRLRQLSMAFPGFPALPATGRELKLGPGHLRAACNTISQNLLPLRMRRHTPTTTLSKR